MIYTVTFNPSLDYLVSLNEFHLGCTNRTVAEEIVPGGKGINVSIVLQNLGLANTALGFVAGFTGEEILRQLEAAGVKTDFIKLEKGMSRINLKLLSVDGTEINGGGPSISAEKVQELMERLQQLQQGDVLFLAGSIPTSLPSDIYQRIMKQLEGRGVCIVVDAAKDLLTNTLTYHPFLIKPNHHELGELFGVSLQTRQDVIPYGKKLQEMGARNVLISLGGEGAVLIAEDGQVLKMAAPRGKVINSVGAGDSMVAGFVAGWLEKQDYAHAFAMGVAAGSAGAFSKQLPDRNAIKQIFPIIKTEQNNTY